MKRSMLGIVAGALVLGVVVPTQAARPLQGRGVAIYRNVVHIDVRPPANGVPMIVSGSVNLKLSQQVGAQPEKSPFPQIGKFTFAHAADYWIGKLGHLDPGTDLCEFWTMVMHDVEIDWSDGTLSKATVEMIYASGILYWEMTITEGPLDGAVFESLSAHFKMIEQNCHADMGGGSSGSTL